MLAGAGLPRRDHRVHPHAAAEKLRRRNIGDDFPSLETQDPSLTRLTAQFQAPQGLDYDLLDRTLNFGSTRGTLRFEGRKIIADIPSAQLFGGSVRMNAVVTTGQPGARQQMTVDLNRVNFETLTRLYFDYRDSRGLVSGRYNFSFVPGKPEQMHGEGNLLVEDGNVFAIPVLGPLSFLLDSVVPGAGYQTSRRATCDYTVANGEIRTDNLDVQGQGFVMIGQGSLFFIEDRMDFGVRVNAQGVPGILLYPVSKLFEYVSDGKMTEPKWRPRVLPKNERMAEPPKKEEKAKPPSAGAKPNGRA
ncbi:MAG: AsmA-like C-terminal region-containing protein [Chthoniobacterales bacterium]